MHLTKEGKEAIRNAAFAATEAALVGVDKITRLNLYNDVLEAAKAGVCEALLKHTGYNQYTASELGGLNRATMRVNIRRCNLKMS
jgi:DNA-binding protein Fis